MTDQPTQLPAHWSPALTDSFWTAVNAATYEESAAATLTFAQLLDPNPQPRAFSDGGVNDIRQLYAVQDAITAAGGELTRPVHRAIDALREVWDRELRREQERRPVVPVSSPPPDQTATGSGREAECELYVLLRKAGEDRHEAQALIDRHRDEVLRRAELRRLAAEAQQPDTETRP